MGRKKLFLWVSAVLLGLSLLAVWVRHDTFSVETTRNRFDIGLGSPLKVALLADLHLDGPLGEFEREVAREVVKENAGVLILAGDLVNSRQGLPALEEFLELAAGTSKIVAIEGNWEEELFPPEEKAGLAGIIEKKGGVFLFDEWTDCETGGIKVRFGGLGGSFWMEKWRRFLKKEPPGELPRVLIAHSPAFRMWMSKKDGAGRFALAFAGHTHGGQVAPLSFLLRPFTILGEYSSGWYEGDPVPLYITRGIGTSHIPVRLLAKPEISVFELY